MSVIICFQTKNVENNLICIHALNVETSTSQYDGLFLMYALLRKSMLSVLAIQAIL